MGDIPEWDSFKNITITPYTIGTDQTATSKEELRNLFGEPDETEDKSDFWRQPGRGIAVSYDNGNKAMDKMLLIADERLLQEAPDISYGTPVKDVLDRFGRPNIVSSRMFSTSFYWKMADNKFFVVSFIKDKALSSHVTEDTDESQ